MLSWLAEKTIARNMRAIRAGDPGPSLAMDADDISFSFPGDSSFAPGAEGKRELEQWLNRFVGLGLQIDPDREYEVSEDTEETRRLDEYLVRAGKA
jgi:hypothetical protein